MFAEIIPFLMKYIYQYIKHVTKHAKVHARQSNSVKLLKILQSCSKGVLATSTIYVFSWRRNNIFIQPNTVSSEGLILFL